MYNYCKYIAIRNHDFTIESLFLFCHMLQFVFCITVCKQTVHSRNHVQQHRQRPSGGVDSGGTGMLHYCITTVFIFPVLEYTLMSPSHPLSVCRIDGEFPPAPAPCPAGSRTSRYCEPCLSPSGQRPRGQKAGGARSNGPDARNVQLHAGEKVQHVL